MMTDEPGRVDSETPDLAAEKLAQLQELFPGAFADGVVDAARIGELVGMPVAGLKDGRERYGLMWAGKQEAVASLLKPSRGTLAPDVERSINFENARNVFIEGDNLEVLKILQKSYNDQVKLIYIDPPYNTGNDFVYNDDFTDGLRGYLEYTGQIDAEGKRTSAVSDTSGRRHSGWLSMMYPRLVLARNLLKQDGAIFVSIDDNEAANLKLLLDEVFGQENFIAQMVWAAGKKNDSRLVSASHEYLLVYARNLAAVVAGGGTWRTRKDGIDEIQATYNKSRKQHGDDHDAVTSDMKAWFKALDEGSPAKRHKHYSRVDSRGVYFPDNISWPGGGGPKYEVLHPVTQKPVAVPSRGWMFSSPARMQEVVAEDRVHFGPDESYVPAIKAYLVDRQFEVPYSVFYVDGRGATKRLRTLLGGDYFDNPKDETVLQKIVEFASAGDDIVLDFFAGSGTTAHAVALQNAADGGRRRVISVNLPEPTSTGSAAKKAGFETVSAVTYARLLKVIETVGGAAADGLRVLNLAESSFAEVESTDDLVALLESSRRAEAIAPDIAQEVLLREGVRLDRPWATSDLGGAERFASGGVTVVTELELTQDAIDAAIESNPRVLVFLEDAFADKDALKASAFYACKQAGVTMKTV